MLLYITYGDFLKVCAIVYSQDGACQQLTEVRSFQRLLRCWNDKVTSRQVLRSCRGSQRTWKGHCRRNCSCKEQGIPTEKQSIKHSS